MLSPVMSELSEPGIAFVSGLVFLVCLFIWLLLCFCRFCFWDFGWFLLCFCGFWRVFVLFCLARVKTESTDLSGWREAAEHPSGASPPSPAQDCFAAAWGCSLAREGESTTGVLRLVVMI